MDITQTRCDKVQAKSIEAHLKADQERKAMRKDLDGVRNDLTKITYVSTMTVIFLSGLNYCFTLFSDELEESKKQHLTYIHSCESCRKKLADNDQELKILEVREENNKVAEELESIKVKLEASFVLN